jgi:hypothetical protein
MLCAAAQHHGGAERGEETNGRNDGQGQDLGP